MKLYAHQKESVTTLDAAPRICDFSDPGTGKTAVHVIAYSNYKLRGGKCALVLAPKTLLVSVWESEFKQFAPWLLTSTAFAKNRTTAFNQVADVYITNIDATVWLAKQKAAFFERFDTLIIDESTAYKHHTSARSKALRKITKYFSVRRILSGTPTENGILDIWNQLMIIDDGVRLGATYYGFRAATCIPKQIGPKPNHVKWVDLPGIESTVASLINDITIRHKFEECTDIPPNHKYIINFKLSEKHMQIYEEFEKQSMIELQNAPTVRAINGAVRYGKLLQIASGAVYSRATTEKEIEAGEGDYVLIDNDRYELIADLVAARKNAVVLFNWQHQRVELERIFKSRKISYAVIKGNPAEINETVKEFQNGWYKVILANPQKAAHGLTLTKATTTIFASPPLRAGFYIQGLKRIYRLGQTQKTETITIAGLGTLDEAVANNTLYLNNKMFDLLEYLKTKNK